MMVHVAVVIHEYGCTIFAGRTLDEADEKLFKWCKDELETAGGYVTRHMSERDVINNYFDKNCDETLFYTDDILKDPIPLREFIKD